ncbi:11527_t:CDS:1, partial [Racocetra fulgida]
KRGRFVSQKEIILDVDMIQELPQDGIEEEEMPQVEPIEEVIIIQEKAAKVKKAPYTGMSRTTAWRKKQKVNTSLNIEASPDLSHLFLAANIVKQLQSPQPPFAVLLANALLLVNLT